MGLFFLGNEREDFVAMVAEVTQGVEDLRLGDSQGIRDGGNGFALLMQRDHVAHAHPQSVNHRLAAANACQANNVGVFGLYGFGHPHASQEKIVTPLPI